MQALGFTQYESQVYLSLLKQSNVSGYELAKQSGVPASKIYAILNKLLDKEVVLIIDGDPKKYIPIPPEEIIRRLKEDFLETLDRLHPELQQIYAQDAAAGTYIWNLSGRAVIMRKVCDFISKAQKQIFLSVWDEELDELKKALIQAERRGVAIRIVHFGKKVLNVGKEYRHGREHLIRVERGGRRIALEGDEAFVLLGHFLEDESSNAVWTTNKGLVLLTKDYIIHDIYSIRMVQKFGRQAEDIFELR